MNDLIVRGEDGIKQIDKYEYLIQHVISSPVNMNQLRSRVREIYFDQLAMSDDGDVPSLTKIVDYVDEENMTTIFNFFVQCGYDEEHIDQMIARYAHDVSCVLDDYVSDILKGYGLSVSGDPYYIMRSHKNYADDAQNILFPQLL